MERKWEEIHAPLNTNMPYTQNMGFDNNSQAENVHNTTRVTLGQWIGKEKKYMHLLIQTHTQNMG